MHTVHLRILIERKTRADESILSPERVAETAVAALLDGTGGRLRGFNMEGYRWMEKGRGDFPRRILRGDPRRPL